MTSTKPPGGKRARPPLASDHRECHIGGDFLLIYRIEAAAIAFVRAGTHSELFEE